MDIVTQVVLGAGVGEYVLGKKIGNKAIAWGALGGLIPDLDIFISPFFNEVEGLFVHRGFSHSLIFPFLIAPLLGWLIHKLYKNSASLKEWILLFFWSAFTHPILDYFTSYGTGAFLPFSGYRVEFSTISIIDIFYTLPFIIVLLIIPFIKRKALIRQKLISFTLLFTTLYLLATVGNKLYVNKVFEEAFAKNNIEYTRYKTVPLPLTNFLWMGIAETSSGYYLSLYSNFDSNSPSDFNYISRNNDRLNLFQNAQLVNKLKQFTKGYYHVGKDQKGVYLADLRFGKMGLNKEADYVFKFYIKDKGNATSISQSKDSRKLSKSEIYRYIKRIFGEK